jgi:hypothetical protein
LSEAIRNLSAKCRTAFKEAGIDLNEFAATAVRISFWYSGLGRERDILVGELSPTSFAALLTLAATGYGPKGERLYATTIDAWVDGAATTTSHVVLHKAFIYANALKQNNILVHEALHVYTGQFDLDLARKFGIDAATDLDASRKLISFFDESCQRQ